jgi:isopentenyl-diphosphate delta-isomerase
MVEVQLVNPNDEPIGSMEKLEAHEKGLLHRAISVFVFNSKGEMLLQRRALKKYHSPGLWTNTCCSHPYPLEIPEQAAVRRLNEEMNIDSSLRFAFKFIYKTEFSNGLIEHELDHVFIGHSDATPHLNTDEAVAFKWINMNDLKKDIVKNPENYTVWFKIIIDEHFNQLNAHLS